MLFICGYVCVFCCVVDFDISLVLVVRCGVCWNVCLLVLDVIVTDCYCGILWVVAWCFRLLCLNLLVVCAFLCILWFGVIIDLFGHVFSLCLLVLLRYVVCGFCNSVVCSMYLAFMCLLVCF